MAKHLKQVHGEQIAREQSTEAESAAASFARLVSKQAEKPEKKQPEKQLDGDETAAEKPMTSVGALASSITEFIGNKFNELINSMSWLQQGQKQQATKSDIAAMKSEVLAAINEGLAQKKAAACK